MTVNPKYFVGSYTTGDPFRCYASYKYFEPRGHHSGSVIWRGDSYAEGLKAAKAANAKNKSSKNQGKEHFMPTDELLSEIEYLRAKVTALKKLLSEIMDAGVLLSVELAYRISEALK